MASAADWISAFFPTNSTFIEGTECDLADSMRRGETTVGVVLSLLEHTDSRLRGCVGWALHELGDKYESFLPAIYHALADSSDDVRYWSVHALQLVSNDQKVEAILHLLPLIKDDAYWVRIGACELIHSLGRPYFECAIDADPSRFGFPSAQVSAVTAVQAALREGYARFTQNDQTPPASQSLEPLAQLGYAMGVGYRLLESVEMMKEGALSFTLDARQFLAGQAGCLIESGIEAVRPMALDRELRLRRRSWLTLNSIAIEVTKWQRYLPDAARDPDPKVRKACLFHLHHGIPHETIKAVIASCEPQPGDLSSCDDAIEALKTLSWIAIDVSSIEERILKGFIEALDDRAVSFETRLELLRVLQAFAELYMKHSKAIDWLSISKRMLPYDGHINGTDPNGT